MPRALQLPAVIVLMLAALSAGPSASAQDSRDWYQVEVIIFRHWATADSERFRSEAPPPEFRRLTVLRGDGSRAFRRLGSGELQLTGAADRLTRSPDYEVLEHFGWAQPALTEQEAISVALPLGWQPSVLTFNAEMHPLGVPVIKAPERPDANTENAERQGQSAQEREATETASADAVPSVFDGLPERAKLYGTLTLFRGRYLHIDADLRYRLHRYQASWTERETVTGPPVYVLQQRRRMRSDELHYLDHPTVGLLVKVRPIARAEPREEAAQPAATSEEPGTTPEDAATDAE